MTDRVAQVLLRYRLDKQSISTLKADLAAIRREMEATNATAEDVSGAGQQAGDSLKQAFDSSASSRIAEIRAQMEATKNQTTATAAEFDKLRASIKGASEAEAVSGGSAFFGRGGKIASIGREVKSLPAVPIPGTGLSTDALAKIVGLIGQLGPTVAVTAVAVGIAAAGFALLNKMLEGNRKALDAAIVGLDAYYNELHKRTSVSAKQQIEDLKGTNADIKAEMDVLANSIKGGVQSTKDQFSGLIDVASGVLSISKDAATQALVAITPTKGVLDKYNELQKKYDENQGAIDSLTRSLGDSAVQANDLAEQEKKLQQARDAAAEQEISNATQYAQLIRTGSSDQIRERIASIQDENTAIQNAMDSWRLSEEELTKLKARLFENNTELSTLQNSILGVVQAREAETKAAEKQAEIQKQSASAYEKYLNDLVTIQDKHQQDTLNAADKYNQSLVNIAEKAAEAAENLARKLEEKREDLFRKLGQDQSDAQAKAEAQALDAQIKFQRTEAQAARNHQYDLEKIRRDAAEREFDLVLNRDFAGLFASRRQTARQIEESNTQYQQQREDRLTAFQQESEDRNRHFIEDEQQRQIKYQRDLQEAQIQYQREYLQAARNRNDALQKAAQAYQQDLQLLNQKFQAELTQRRQAIVAELQTIQQGDAQKLALERQYYLASMQLLRSAISGASGGASTPAAVSTGSGPIQVSAFASGGSMRAGQIGLVNDGFPGQRESFNGMPLPRGMGLFMPAVSGRVSSGGGGGMNYSPTYNITGGDPKRIADEVSKRTRADLKFIFGK